MELINKAFLKDLRRRRRGSNPTRAYWNVYGLRKSPRTADGERETPPSDRSVLVLTGGAQPSFQPADKTQGTTNIEGLRQAYSHFKEGKRTSKTLHGITTSDVPAKPLGHKKRSDQHPSHYKHTLASPPQSHSCCQSLVAHTDEYIVVNTRDHAESRPPLTNIFRHVHD